MKTFISLLSGPGGADEGARQAGLDPAHGFEWDPQVVAIAQANDHPVIHEDVTETRFSRYTGPDWLHASPVCKRLSKGNPQARENDLDRSVARAITVAIGVWQPEVFSLENVVEYAKSWSLDYIKACLQSWDYHIEIRHIDCWRYGVPQTRRRLILLARKSKPPVFPQPDPEFYTPTWNRALEDLIPGLPQSRLANWQQAYWDDWGGNRGEMVWIVGGNTAGTKHNRTACVPAFVPAPTVAGSKQGNPHIWIPQRSCFVQTTTACLARLQTFPDTYAWPGTRKVVHTAIGNAVPPELMRRLVRANMEETTHEPAHVHYSRQWREHAGVEDR